MLLIAENPERAVRYIRDSIRESFCKAKQTDISEEELTIECAKVPSFKVMFCLEELSDLRGKKVFLVPGVENHPEFNRYMLALKVAGISGVALDVSKFYAAEDLEKLPDSASVRGLVGKLKKANINSAIPSGKTNQTGKSNATDNS